MEARSFQINPTRTIYPVPIRHVELPFQAERLAIAGSLKRRVRIANRRIVVEIVVSFAIAIASFLLARAA